MKKLLIVKTDNSIVEQNLSDTDFLNTLANSVAEHTINANLTMWVYKSEDFNSDYNNIANDIYNDYRGMNELFFYGDVVFTGRSTDSGVDGINAEEEELVRSYLRQENTNA